MKKLAFIITTFILSFTLSFISCVSGPDTFSNQATEGRTMIFARPSECSFKNFSEFSVDFTVFINYSQGSGLVSPTDVRYTLASKKYSKSELAAFTVVFQSGDLSLPLSEKKILTVNNYSDLAIRIESSLSPEDSTALIKSQDPLYVTILDANGNLIESQKAKKIRKKLDALKVFID